MNTPKIAVSMIAGLIEKTRAIGKGPDLLVRISDDMKRFKATTMGHPIIMGRKTFESLGRPLPGRTNIVVTRNPQFKADGIIICPTIEEAIAKAREIESQSKNSQKEIFIIGGGEIYTIGLPVTDKLYLTIVDAHIEGDVFFPQYDEFNKITFKEDRVDEKSGLKYSWVNLER